MPLGRTSHLPGFLPKLPICSSCLWLLRTASRSNIAARPEWRRAKHGGSRGNIARDGEQAMPLSGFYADMLRTPTSKSYARILKRPITPPKPAAQLEPKAENNDPFLPPDPNDVRERAKIVFGSRLAGPAQRRADKDRQSMNIGGVLVPPKPQEPDNCCMSGCVNCVWDVYREDLEEWAAKAAEARQKLLAEGKLGTADEKRLNNFKAGGTSGKDIPVGAMSMDDDGGGSETNWTPGSGLPQAGGQQADLFAAIPVGIREFMKTEKMLKERHSHGARPGA